MKSISFERFGGLCAILTGISGFLYSVAFIIISRNAPALGDLLSALFLMLGGLLATAALVGVYNRLRETEAELRALRVKVLAVATDVTAPGAIEAFVDQAARDLGLEGIVAKKADSPYRAGRSEPSRCLGVFARHVLRQNL